MCDEQTMKRTREDGATQLNGYTRRMSFAILPRKPQDDNRQDHRFLYSHLLSPASLPSPKLFLVETEDGDGQLGILLIFL